MTVVYIVDPDPVERRWMETVLTPTVEAVRSFDNAEALLALLGERGGAVLVISVKPDEAVALELVCALRLAGSMIPVIALGPETAFRTAIDIARLNFTDFVERPVSAFKLRSAVRRATQGQLGWGFGHRR